MKIVTSAGGVVFLNDTILLLRKFNGDWVLPKGHIESGEHRIESALREVQEEAGVKGTVHEYIGQINYEYNDVHHHCERTAKTVHWYLMTAKNDYCVPQREEGFNLAKYIPIEEALSLIKYEDERLIVNKAIDVYQLSYFDLTRDESPS